MNRIHKLTLLSFGLVAVSIVLFLCFAEGNYSGFHSTATSSAQYGFWNTIMALSGMFLVSTSLLSVVFLLVDWIRGKKIGVLALFLGLYPILILLWVSSFRLETLGYLLRTPFLMLFYT